jgi:CheY-like chemotaxis protein
MVRAYNPDLILMDICLPEMDGYQVFTQLSEDEATRHIPVIALSAGAMPHEIEKGLRSGFRRYLTKPVDIGELLRAVKDVLQDSQAQQATRL